MRPIVSSLSFDIAGPISAEIKPVGIAEAVLTYTTSLITWLRADSGTFTDAARTAAASANNDPVRGWTDQSGLGRHGSSVTSVPPLLKLGGHNGKTALVFNSNSMQFIASNTGMTAMDAYVVVKYTGASRILVGGAATGFDPYLYFDNTLIRFDCRDAGARGFFADANTPSTTIPFVINARLSATTVFCAVNSSAIAATAAANKVFDANAIGKWEGGTGGNPRADLYEMLIYQSVLSAGDRTTVLNYLNSKYALY